MPKMVKPKGRIVPQLGDPDISDIAGLMGPFGIAGMAPKLLRERGRGLIDQLAKLFQENPDTSYLKGGVQEALQVAQQRWPRLFGHIDRVGHVNKQLMPEAAGAQNIPWNRITETIDRALGEGKNLPEARTLARGTKFSDLRFAPENFPGIKSLVSQGEPGANVVGHELLHAADQVGLPRSKDLYEFAGNLPGGYAGISQEFRAKNMGDRMEKIVKAIREASRGGKGPSGVAAFRTHPSLPAEFQRLEDLGPIEEPLDEAGRTLLRRRKNLRVK